MKNTPSARKLLPFVLLAVASLVFSCTKSEYFSEHRGNYGEGPGFGETYRSVIPINITYLSLADTRASITLLINGKPVDVLFDTGSFGLRVVAGAIPGIQPDTDTTEIFETYTGGTGLKGKVADATLAVGKLQSTAPIKLMRIDAVNRDSGAFVPTANSATSNDPLLNGFNGIVGVGLRFGVNQHGVANPLTQMPGNATFIIHFPQFNDGKNGVLILNPSADDMRGFSFVHLKVGSVLLPNGLNSWLDDQLQGTVTVDGVPYAHNTLLDSGNPYDYFYKDTSTHDRTIGIDTTVKLSLLSPPLETTFTIKNRISGQDLVAVNKEQVRDVFGIQFFFLYDVLYDQRNGLIGIRKRNN